MMKVTKHVSVLALWASCAPVSQGTDTTATQQNLGGATDCEPTGAIPNDGIDDRAAFQNALDTKHCAIPSVPGVYDISVNPMGAPKVSLRLTGGMRLSGHG